MKYQQQQRPLIIPKWRTSRILGGLLLLVGLLHTCQADHHLRKIEPPRILQEVEESQLRIPPSCHQRIAPTYRYDDSASRLEIDIANIVPKTLQVEVDYDTHILQLFGWLDRPVLFAGDHLPTCIYQEWKILSEDTTPKEATNPKANAVVVDLRDVVMERQDGLLIVTIPTTTQSTTPTKGLSLRVGTSPKLRGLARIHLQQQHKEQQRQQQVPPKVPGGNSTTATASSRVVGEKPTTTISSHDDGTTDERDTRNEKSKERRQALERFLSVSLAHTTATTTDEEAYWLHKM